MERICDICLKYKKPKLRPAVGFSLSKDFHVVAVDLKQIVKTCILHLFDQAKRYSAAAMVKSKKKEDIAEAIIKNWIAISGAPQLYCQIMGGEFNHELFREVCEQFNITIKSTVAEAPWFNGIVEQHNAVLEKIIKKLKLDNNNIYSIDDIVLWGISAKNWLQSCYGFSPNQLAFGKSANLPSNLVNLPPALEDVSHPDILVKNLNALHAARKAFIKAESNDKLYCALKVNTRETTGIQYKTGDMVYYKRKSSGKWKGPGTVIGKENKQILVKHGGYYISTSA